MKSMDKKKHPPKKSKKAIAWMTVCALLLTLIVWALWGNKAVEINRYTVASQRLPEAFDGYRIAHISDLHNTTIGKDNEKLLRWLEQTQPDLIAITGDMIDSRHTDVEAALGFAAEAAKIAPCYFAPGNHESRVPEYIQLKEGLLALGVTVLEDAQVLLEREGQRIRIVGLVDPAFFGDHPQTIRDTLPALCDDTQYTLLLSHRPELFDIYAENSVDLVLSGHAHGGQFRLPLVGGVYAPHQGLFPPYDGGIYTESNTHMIVSRGIGNSIVPLRINNRPEIILVELQYAE